MIRRHRLNCCGQPIALKFQVPSRLPPTGSPYTSGSHSADAGLSRAAVPLPTCPYGVVSGDPPDPTVPKAAPYENRPVRRHLLLRGNREQREVDSRLAFGRRSAHDERLFAEKLRMPRFLQTERLALVFELAFPMNSPHDLGVSRRSE